MNSNSTKHRRMISLDEETNQFIEDYMIKYKKRFPGEAIEEICQKYKELENKEWSLQQITQTVSNELKNDLKKELKKLQLGVNHADKNTQIALELLNGAYYHHGWEGVFTTDYGKDSTKYAWEAVEKRIEKQRQQRLEQQMLND
ncbi:hypothetical protein [Priestia megaterium]|uniref:hypothetical protein n=1 Tax=Priestia megaterium TaxID=1404 RepID=UPI0011A34D9A|nr:hypothetical protein [Priestia megaterium]